MKTKTSKYYKKQILKLSSCGIFISDLLLELFPVEEDQKHIDNSGKFDQAICSLLDSKKLIAFDIKLPNKNVSTLLLPSGSIIELEV